MTQLTDAEILERIKKVIMAHTGIAEDRITLDTTFQDDLEADSLDIIELGMRFEEAFKINMSDESLVQLRSVSDMFNYVKTQINEKK